MFGVQRGHNRITLKHGCLSGDNRVGIKGQISRGRAVAPARDTKLCCSDHGVCCDGQVAEPLLQCIEPFSTRVLARTQQFTTNLIIGNFRDVNLDTGRYQRNNSSNNVVVRAGVAD